MDYKVMANDMTFLIENLICIASAIHPGKFSEPFEEFFNDNADKIQDILQVKFNSDLDTWLASEDHVEDGWETEIFNWLVETDKLGFLAEVRIPYNKDNNYGFTTIKWIYDDTIDGLYYKAKRFAEEWEPPKKG